MQLPHDAAGPAQCPCETLMRVPLKNKSPSKLQLWLLRAASRLRKRFWVVAKNQDFEAAVFYTTIVRSSSLDPRICRTHCDSIIPGKQRRHYRLRCRPVYSSGRPTSGFRDILFMVYCASVEWHMTSRDGTEWRHGDSNSRRWQSCSILVKIGYCDNETYMGNPGPWTSLQILPESMCVGWVCTAVKYSVWNNRVVV
jgi:hypothetical protein